MRFIDFIIELLKAQANTLQRLAAFFGEEKLLEILEAADQIPRKENERWHLNPAWFEPSSPAGSSSHSLGYSSGYAELEWCVHELKLTETLEFHLWAYPFYRVLIESAVDLKSKIRDSEDPVIELLVNESVSEAAIWVKSLPLSPELSTHAQQIVQVPWLRFRSEVYRKSGKSPLSKV